jgi:hypothetical protein
MDPSSSHCNAADPLTIAVDADERGPMFIRCSKTSLHNTALFAMQPQSPGLSMRHAHLLYAEPPASHLIWCGEAAAMLAKDDMRGVK